MEQRLKELQRTSNDTTFYWSSDVHQLIGENTPSISSFRRRVREGKIRTVDVGGRETAYNAEDVQRFFRGALSLPRGGARRKKKVGSLGVSITPPAVKAPLIGRAQPDDLPHVFIMEYAQVGMRAAGPHTVMSWLNKNSEAYWLLCNPMDRQDVWATLGMLPLADEVIFQLLRGEIALNEITPSSIRVYESGGDYSYYLSAIARPEHQAMLPLLVRHVFAHWCEQPPSFTIKNFYLLTHGFDASPAWQIAKEFFFSPRYDISQAEQENLAWELRLDIPNPSIDIQTLKECIEKQSKGITSMTTSSILEAPVTDEKSGRSRERLRNLARFRPFGPEGVITKDARFRRAETDEDIKEVLRINAAMFGPSKLSQAELIRMRRAWLDRNPEIYHILEYQGKIVGFLSLLPVPLETVNKLVRSEIGVSQVPLDDILPFSPDTPVNIFIQTLAVDPAFEEDQTTFKKFGSWLSKGVMNTFLEWGKHGIEVSKVFARSDTPYGAYISIGLGFEEILAPEGVHKRVFVMDVARSEQPFLLDYRRALEEYRQAHNVNGYV